MSPTRRRLPIRSAEFVTRPRVEKTPAGTWSLIAPLHYQSVILQKILLVPMGFLTDFASVPRVPFAYWLAGNTAHGAAIVHDYLYQTHRTDRATADRVFDEAMEVEGEPAWRRWMMWLAVRTVGMWAWASGPKRYGALKNYIPQDRRHR